MKTKVLVITALATAVCASALWSQGGGRFGGPGGPGGPGMMIGAAMAVIPPPAFVVTRFAVDLQLTEGQAANLTEAMNKGDAAILPLQQRAAKAVQALRAAWLLKTSMQTK